MVNWTAKALGAGPVGCCISSPGWDSSPLRLPARHDAACRAADTVDVMDSTLSGLSAFRAILLARRANSPKTEGACLLIPKAIR